MPALKIFIVCRVPPQSLTASHPFLRRRPQPLAELSAMAKDEIKARLAPIPLFTVANPKNEFVLVAGENNSQLGFFFTKREDAEVRRE